MTAKRNNLSELDPHLRTQFDDNWFKAAEWGNTALLASFRNDYVFDVDYCNPRGTNALMEAAFAGHGDTVSWLLEQHSDPNRQGTQGGGALAHAAVGDQSEVIRILIAAGADIDQLDDQRGFTALAQACMRDHRSCIQTLLTLGADPWVGTQAGGAAFEHSVSLGREAALELLIAHRDERWPQTWIDHGFWCAGMGGQAKGIARFLEQGADPLYIPENQDMNALHKAALHGQSAVIPLLIDAGCPVDCVSSKGWTALLLALKNKHPEAGHALIAAGADPNLAEPSPHDVTPLMHAAVLGDVAVIEQLLDRGADAGARDGAHQMTALEWAEGYQQQAATELLRGIEPRKH